jgi:hypothetical protein
MWVQGANLHGDRSSQLLYSRADVTLKQRWKLISYRIAFRNLQANTVSFKSGTQISWEDWSSCEENCIPLTQLQPAPFDERERRRQSPQRFEKPPSSPKFQTSTSSTPFWPSPSRQRHCWHVAELMVLTRPQILHFRWSAALLVLSASKESFMSRVAMRRVVYRAYDFVQFNLSRTFDHSVTACKRAFTVFNGAELEYVIG